MRLWGHLYYIFWSTNHSHWHNDIFKGFVGQCWFFMYGSQASLERRTLKLSSRYVPSSRYVRWTTVVPDLIMQYYYSLIIAHYWQPLPRGGGDYLITYAADIWLICWCMMLGRSNLLIAAHSVHAIGLILGCDAVANVGRIAGSLFLFKFVYFVINIQCP